MEQGEVEAEIIRQALKSGRPIPAKIADAPILMPWLEGIYHAFTELDTCRGEGYIPWTAIHQYATYHSYTETEEDFTRFLSLIRAMDNAYNKKMQERHKKEAAKAKPLGKKK